jgi:fatty acid desaturase
MPEQVKEQGGKKTERRYPSEMHRRQRAKNWAVFIALAGFVILVYFVAIVRMSGG